MKNTKEFQHFLLTTYVAARYNFFQLNKKKISQCMWSLFTLDNYFRHRKSTGGGTGCTIWCKISMTETNVGWIYTGHIRRRTWCGAKKRDVIGLSREIGTRHSSIKSPTHKEKWTTYTRYRTAVRSLQQRKRYLDTWITTSRICLAAGSTPHQTESHHMGGNSRSTNSGGCVHQKRN